MFEKKNVFSGFSVDDLQKAKEFYTKILNMDVVENEMGVLNMKLDSQNFVVIYPKKNHEAATFTVLNFEVENIGEAVDSLSGKGVKFLQYDAPIKTNTKGICSNGKGHSVAWFKDPAGNILSVMENI